MLRAWQCSLQLKRILEWINRSSKLDSTRFCLSGRPQAVISATLKSKRVSYITNKWHTFCVCMCVLSFVSLLDGSPEHGVNPGLVSSSGDSRGNVPCRLKCSLKTGVSCLINSVFSRINLRQHRKGNEKNRWMSFCQNSRKWSGEMRQWELINEKLRKGRHCWLWSLPFLSHFLCSHLAWLLFL